MKIHHRTIRQNHDMFAAEEGKSAVTLTHHRQDVILAVQDATGKKYGFRGSLADLCAKLVKLENKP